MFHGGISLLDLLDPKKVLPPPPMQFFWGGVPSHLHDSGQDDSS